MPSQRVTDLKGAATYLGITPAAAHKRWQRRELKGAWKEGGRVCVDLRVLERWVTSRSSGQQLADAMAGRFSPALSSRRQGASEPADAAGGARAYSTRPRRPNPNEAA